MPKSLGKLTNNIRYVIETNKCFNTTSVMLSVKTGSRNEQKTLYGISHLLEHMLFQGTNNLSNKETNLLIHNNGGSRNGSTTNTITNYYINIPKKGSKIAFIVLSDMLFNSNFSNFVKEKLVILNEIISWRKSSYQILQNEVDK